MDIILVSNIDQKMKKIGNSDIIPIPRVGENVYVGYSPAPKVLSVGYSYEDNAVMVVLDGSILQ